MKRTKIIATIGPASEKRSTLEKMAKAGMDICRLNFSFGTHEEHLNKIAMIREVSKRTGKSLAILQDLQGPKIRIGKLTAPVKVKKGDEIILSGKTVHKSTFYLPTTYPLIASDTKPGKTILLADGRIILQVKSADPRKKEAICKVTCGGTILTGKGINLPYTDISMPALSKKDIADAKFGIKAGVDAIALSFVRSAEDIMKLRRLLKKENSDIPIIAKLEKPEALDNLDAIVIAADGVMVARGDLADEISFEQVPVAQKKIINAANAKAKLTIIATEMLSSMVDNPLPTRAEVSDVANGVLDGTDIVMLSNETATGKYPAKAVQTMTKIIKEAENILPSAHYLKNFNAHKKYAVTEAMCLAASFLSHELNERAIAVLTSSGNTARIMAKTRPETTIFAATANENIYYRMALYNNVWPLLLRSSDPEDTARTYLELENMLIAKKLAKKGELIITLNGIHQKGGNWSLNSIHTVTLGE
ncbi:MAG: pyruvate kinase [Victivallaceae bacterium]|nr:pyruvate kinase [Victivallaceae bacterium]